jgi:predicted metal-dependent HD superfamily phosphohydrolase
MTRDDLIAAYAAPNRHYYDLAHIEDCLDKLTRMTTCRQGDGPVESKRACEFGTAIFRMGKGEIHAAPIIVAGETNASRVRMAKARE